MTAKPELCTLPTEIQHVIVLNLHPSAAVALRQTNRWFNTHISLHRLDQIEVRKYLGQCELRPKNAASFACFSCLNLKPQTAFTMTQVHSANGKGHPHTYKRYCLECGIRDGKYKPSALLRMAGYASTVKVLCGGCASVQTYYCSRCLCCSGCIAKMKTWTGRARWNQSGAMAVCPQHLRR